MGKTFEKCLVEKEFDSSCKHKNKVENITKKDLGALKLQFEIMGVCLDCKNEVRLDKTKTNWFTKRQFFLLCHEGGGDSSAWFKNYKNFNLVHEKD